jgi:DNA-binding transcriptional ArsR family regulator
VALAVVAVVGFPAVGVGGDLAGVTGQASASNSLSTDFLTTTELLTTTDATLTETTTESSTTETSTAETSTTTGTTNEESTTALVTTTEGSTTAILTTTEASTTVLVTTTEESTTTLVTTTEVTTTDLTTTTGDDPTNDTDDVTNETEDLTNETDGLSNETEDLTNQTEGLTNESERVANSTETLTNATGETLNATDELANATNSLEAVSTVAVRTRFSVSTATLSGTASGTLEAHLTVGSQSGDDSELRDDPELRDEPPDSEGKRGGTTTASGGTTAAEDDQSETTTGGSDANDRNPARDERGGPVESPEIVLEFGALTAAALVPQLADVFAVFANAGGVSASSAAASSALGARGSLRSRLDRFWRFVTPFRYSRWDDSDPLDHEVRAALYEAIERSPGAYLSEVSERADVALSTARHHLDVLEDEGLVATAKVRGKRRYYPDHAPDVELTAALEDEATADVLDALARLGASHGGRLADELDRDASTVSHHLSRLEDAGLVEREREGRTVVNRLTPEVRAVLRGSDDGETPAVAD